MTAKRQGRSAWTKRDSAAPRQGGSRRGVAIHWPGFDFTISDHGDCLQLLARLERDALANKAEDYAAIPYCQAACVHGYLIEGRGSDRRSGANGSTLANRDYGSVVALIPIDQKRLPRELLEALRAALTVQAPRGRLVSHRDVRPEPTACPGKLLTDWLKDGARLPAAPRAAGPSRTITVREGDTLWSLADKHLGDGEKWPQLVKANRLTMEQVDNLPVGKRLRLP